MCGGRNTGTTAHQGNYAICPAIAYRGIGFNGVLVVVEDMRSCPIKNGTGNGRCGQLNVCRPQTGLFEPATGEDGMGLITTATTAGMLTQVS